MAEQIQILNNGETLYNFRNIINDNFALMDEKTLNKGHITNCLLDVPQKIMVEVSNEYLTLKAGSQVIIPDGFEADGVTPKFVYEIIGSDVSRTFQSANGNLVVYTKNVPWVTGNEQRFDYFTNGDNMFSGPTQPVAQLVNALWYNTATNKIMASPDFGTTWVEAYCSLPICIIKSDSQRTITGIHHVFNGFGYIGSTIWIDNGVTGLVPDGRNADGSLKNITWDVPSITVMTLDTQTSHQKAVIAFNPNEPINGHKFGVISMQSFRHNDIQNRNYDIDNEWAYTPIAYATVTNGVISAFSPKLPFRVAHNQDLVRMYGFTMDAWEYDSTLGVYVLNVGQMGTGLNVFKQTDLGNVIVQFVDIVVNSQGILTLHSLDTFDGYLIFT